MLCNLCPRRCDIDRETAVGVCRCGENASVSSYMLHHWEEPCISGTRGAGAVFFSGCPLQCVYCQNIGFSRGGSGKVYSANELAGLFLYLQEKGAHNARRKKFFLFSIFPQTAHGRKGGGLLPRSRTDAGQARTLRKLLPSTRMAHGAKTHAKLEGGRPTVERTRRNFYLPKQK